MLKTSFKILLLIAAFCFWPLFAQAEDECDEATTLDFVARDPGGSYISGAKVEVYKQGYDANGHVKPTTKVAGATTDATLGYAHLSWTNRETASASYAIKVQTVDKSAAAFWYYDNVMGCGSSLSIEKTLSGILFVLHDANGNSLTNTSFNVYSQLYDSSNSPLPQKKELLKTLNSGTAGQVKIYLPQGSVRNIDNSWSDHYNLELTRNSLKFNLYNIAVIEGQLTTVNYYLSALEIHLEDSAGVSYPAGTKVEVYKQEVGLDNERQKGSKVGEFTLNDSGYGSFDVPAGIYVLGVKNKDGQYQYFWDIESLDGRLTEYDLKSSQGSTSSGACQNNSQLTVALRNFSGDLVPGLKFELYEQKTDANGLPTAGTKAAAGTIGSTGQTVVSFKPNPNSTYALKVWDKRADLGEFWFFDAVRFVCNYNRSLTEYVPALKIILRDSQGNFKKNYGFSLYAQEYDADNKPFFQTSDLIANLTTNGGGQSTVYVAPYNPYRRGQTGYYAITAKDANGNVSTFYNIKIPAEKDYTFQSTFSGLSGELRDAQARLLSGREVRLYDASKRLLLKAKTDTNGRYQFEYPAGTYTIASVDDFNRENSFGSVTLKAGSNSKKLSMGAAIFILSNTTGTAGNSLSLYSLTDAGGGSYYRSGQVGTIKLSSNRSSSIALAAGPYLAVYVGKNNQEYGQAFYIKNGTAGNVKIATNAKTVLSAGQSFKISGSTSSDSTPTTTSNSSLSGLKGRILLQVEEKGQAWYVNPVDGKKYYLGRPADAYNVMRKLGLGISNSDFSSLESNRSAWKRLAGRILIKTEDKGKAYYFDPVSWQLYYLGRPADAFNVMRSRGLGAKNSDLNKISTGN